MARTADTACPRAGLSPVAGASFDTSVSPSSAGVATSQNRSRASVHVSPTPPYPKITLRHNGCVLANKEHIGWWSWGQYWQYEKGERWRLTFRAKDGKYEGIGHDAKVLDKAELRLLIAYIVREKHMEETT